MKEKQAVGCAIASLVPFAGLEAMLAQRKHIRWIAERYGVPIDVIEQRIGETNLGELMNAQFVQFALAPG